MSGGGGIVFRPQRKRSRALAVCLSVGRKEARQQAMAAAAASDSGRSVGRSAGMACGRFDSIRPICHLRYGISGGIAIECLWEMRFHRKGKRLFLIPYSSSSLPSPLFLLRSVFPQLSLSFPQYLFLFSSSTLQYILQDSPTHLHSCTHPLASIMQP